MTQIKMGLYNSQGFSPQSVEYKTKFIYKGDMKVQKFHTALGFPSKNQLCLHACDIFNWFQLQDIEAHVKKKIVWRSSCEESTTLTKVMSCVDDEEAKLEMKLFSIPCYFKP
jgi:hypothetical protein